VWHFAYLPDDRALVAREDANALPTGDRTGESCSGAIGLRGVGSLLEIRRDPRAETVEAAGGGRESRDSGVDSRKRVAADPADLDGDPGRSARTGGLVRLIERRRAGDVADDGEAGIGEGRRLGVTDADIDVIERGDDRAAADGIVVPRRGLAYPYLLARAAKRPARAWPGRRPVRRVVMSPDRCSVLDRGRRIDGDEFVRRLEQAHAPGDGHGDERGRKDRDEDED